MAMEFLKDLRKIQVTEPLEVDGRTIHTIVRIYTLNGSNYFTQHITPICLAVEDTEDYIIPINPEKAESSEYIGTTPSEGDEQHSSEDGENSDDLDYLGIDPEEIWNLVKKNNQKQSSSN
ncbi:hypothetical protein [Methanobacterium aggregans]|uniref:hypothetical protein n=1 Tax=Methanobacterium aggregans TaxID=1615586 RepID=UPI001AE81B64|nr:hypothetical protein [Methanobacterium aggregans]MBP2046844.1 hypothetical protein [Methanobacterium aggregans]